MDLLIAELLGVPTCDRAFFRDCADRQLGLRNIDPGTEDLAALIAAATQDLNAWP
ncbi:MAG: hypothetical protein ACRDQ5_09105 [Sciscionella sp.]